MVSDTPGGPCADVAVVILNWNGRHWLEQFLPGVVAHAAGATVVVADNASTDDSVAWLRAHFPQVQVLVHTENLGFCEGYNHALRQLDFRYYLLLNSDVEVTPGWLPPLRAVLEADATAAAVQPKIRQYSLVAAERQRFEYAGAGGGYLDALGFPFCRGRLFDTLETDHGQYDDVRPVAWATGACLLVRASAWRALHGLEPRFFAHMEEIDLCWRLQNAGYGVWYCGHSTVFHVGGGTLPKSNPRKTYLNFRNGLAMVYKNTAPAELTSTLIGRVLLDWVAAGRFVLQGNWPEAQAIARAHWHVWQQRAYWQQQRAAAHPHLRRAQRAGTYGGSLVWAYFGRGKRSFPELQIPDGAALAPQGPAHVHPESQSKIQHDGRAERKE